MEVPSFFHTWELGHDSVILFFVLSGYVVGYSTEHKKGPRSYLVARLSRMCSCLVPALIIVPMLYMVGSRINPYLYHDPTAFSAQNVRTFLETATFTQEYELQSVVYYGDAPLWSLSYEFSYYVLFGLLMFLRGPMRIFAIIIASVIMGPKIILLFPLWFAGYLLFHWRDHFDLAPHLGKLLAWSSALAVPLFVAFDMYFSPRFFYILHVIGIDHMILNQSHYFPVDYLLGAIICIHIVGVRSAFGGGFSWPARFVTSVNWLADRSFAIYVFHFPLLYVAAALLGERRHGLLGGTVMLLASIAGSLALATISDLRKREWRQLITWLVPSRAQISMLRNGRRSC